MRAVCDTNVLISGLLWSGAPYECLLAAEGGLFRLVLSEPILDELREKLVVKFGESAEAADQVLSHLRRIAEIVALRGQTGWIRADPDDDKVVETAVVGNADFIVSGDHHLLDLDALEGIAIIRAIDFMSHLRSSEYRSQE